MASAYGNQVQRWQSYIEAYILSQDNNGATVRCDVYHHSIGWGYNVYGNGEAKVAGQSSGVVNASFYAATGQTRNQHIATKDVWVAKGHAGKNVWCEGIVKHTGGYHNGTSSAGVNVWVGAKPSYTISYNANGGSGAPGNQTKWYGENLTISGTRPTRAGHNFLYWTTDFGSGSVRFDPGSTYTQNQGATLYANWQAHTYTVSYNANGGTGAPGNQTKTYGQNLTLSGTRPTRQNYNFLGWATSANGSVAYQPGSTYTGNSALTLYAVWELAWLEPRITNLTATRCDSAGNLNDEGQYAKVSFNWVTDRGLVDLHVECNGVSYDNFISGFPTVGQTSGSPTIVIGNNGLSTESQYTVTVVCSDEVGGVRISTTVAPMNYIMDVAPNGSVAFGKPARQNERNFEVSIPADFRNRINGYSEVGNLGSSVVWLEIARSTYVSDSNAGGNWGISSGYIRIEGEIGGYTANSLGPIDIYIPTRDFSNTEKHVIVNAWSPKIDHNSCRIVAYKDSANHVHVYARLSSYYRINIRVHATEQAEILWSKSSNTPSGTAMFNTQNITTFNRPMATRNLNSFWGFKLPDGTETEWFRTTYNGLIPYQSGGASALGTDSWPFNSTYTNNLHIKNNNLYWDNTGGLSGRVRKLLWSGSVSIGGKINLPEANYYHMYAISLNSWTTDFLGYARRDNVNTHNYIRFSGGYDNGSEHENYYASFSGSGTTWTYTGGNYHNFTTGVVKPLTVIQKIYGIL